MIRYRAVCIVTVSTCHLAETNRMRRRFIKFCTLLFMAFVTDFRLRFLSQYRILLCMYFMAISAGDVSGLVYAAFPVDVFFPFVAIEAHAVLLRNRLI